MGLSSLLGQSRRRRGLASLLDEARRLRSPEIRLEGVGVYATVSWRAAGEDGVFVVEGIRPRGEGVMLWGTDYMGRRYTVDVEGSGGRIRATAVPQQQIPKLSASLERLEVVL